MLILNLKLSETFKIAVPSSYNELYTNTSIRNHVGWTWYNKEFYINSFLRSSVANYDNTIVLRLASCHYYCIVWLNGFQLGSHESGHLPFEFDVSSIVSSTNQDEKFNLVIAVNNTLTVATIPPASIFYGTDPNL